MLLLKQLQQAKDRKMKILSILTAALLAVSLSAQARQVTLTPDNTVTIRSEIDYNSTGDAQFELVKLVAKRGKATYPIYLVMDSPGGGIDAGNAFTEFAKTIPNVETITLFAASMASSIVQQLPGRRLIVESGVSMYHRAKGGVEGQFEDGEVESRLNFYKDIVRNMEQKNADRMKMPLATYKSLVKDELWILGKDAVKRGAADEIVTVGCSNELVSQSKVIAVQVFVFSMNIKFSGCPLIRSGTPEKPEQKGEYMKFLSQKQARYVWKN